MFEYVDFLILISEEFEALLVMVIGQSGARSLLNCMTRSPITD